MDSYESWCLNFSSILRVASRSMVELASIYIVYLRLSIFWNVILFTFFLSLIFLLIYSFAFFICSNLFLSSMISSWILPNLFIIWSLACEVLIGRNSFFWKLFYNGNGFLTINRLFRAYEKVGFSKFDLSVVELFLFLKVSNKLSC
jgi:hypothetical protein